MRITPKDTKCNKNSFLVWILFRCGKECMDRWMKRRSRKKDVPVKYTNPARQKTVAIKKALWKLLPILWYYWIVNAERRRQKRSSGGTMQAVWFFVAGEALGNLRRMCVATQSHGIIGELGHLNTGTMVFPKDPREKNWYRYIKYFFRYRQDLKGISRAQKTLLYWHQFEFPAALLLTTWRLWWPHCPVLRLWGACRGCAVSNGVFQIHVYGDGVGPSLFHAVTLW